ncbi:MAG: metal ABC transporter substrate-binding protein [Planctomycetota bacterium]|jgi:zinc transport system substrate-binding protein
MARGIHRKSLSLIVLIGVCCVISACSKKADQSQGSTSEASKPVVYTVNYPLAYFAERIGGDWVEVKFPAPTDEDPAYWQPDAATIEEYQNADLILTNGAGYAKWMEMVSLPTSKCVNTSSGFQDQTIELEAALTHSHGPDAEHAHGGLAFTTWLDFSLAVKHAEAIKDAFVKFMPENKSDFEANYTALEKDLLALDADMKAVSEKIKIVPLVVSHPVYQYWARGYGLNVKSVHWEPDQAPTDQQWEDFKGMLKDHPSKWMIWEGRPMTETVDALNAMQIQSIVLDPCGAAPSEKDFLQTIQKCIENLEQIKE